MKTIVKLVLSALPQPKYRNTDDDDDGDEEPTTARDAQLARQIAAAKHLRSKPITLLIDESDGVLSIRVEGDALLSGADAFDLRVDRSDGWGDGGGNPLRITVGEL